MAYTRHKECCRDINRSAGEEKPFGGECKNGSYVFVVDCNDSVDSSVSPTYHHLGITEDDGRLYFLETRNIAYVSAQIRSGTCLKI